jgi:hypothetical protein
MNSGSQPPLFGKCYRERRVEISTKIVVRNPSSSPSTLPFAVNSASTLTIRLRRRSSSSRPEPVSERRSLAFPHCVGFKWWTRNASSFPCPLLPLFSFSRRQERFVAASYLHSLNKMRQPWLPSTMTQRCGAFDGTFWVRSSSAFVLPEHVLTPCTHSSRRNRLCSAVSLSAASSSSPRPTFLASDETNPPSSP